MMSEKEEILNDKMLQLIKEKEDLNESIKNIEEFYKQTILEKEEAMHDLESRLDKLNDGNKQATEELLSQKQELEKVKKEKEQQIK